MKNPRILVVGNTTVDHVLSMTQPIVLDSKFNASSYNVYAGGQAANVAAALALLGGHDVGFAGRFGDDSGGDLNRQAFEQAGVDLRMSTTVENCRHHFACILVSGSHRTIAMYRDARLGLDELEIPTEEIAACAVVYTDGHEGKASLRLAAQAAATGTPVVADMEVMTSYSAELAAKSTHLIAPAEIIRQLGRNGDLAAAMRAILASGPSTVVATMGSSGSLGLEAEADETIAIPAVACTVVDTTGAGDAFHAGYIAGLLRGQSLPDRLRFASTLASAKCEIAGPRLDAAACDRVRDAFFKAPARP